MPDSLNPPKFLVIEHSHLPNKVGLDAIALQVNVLSVPLLEEAAKKGSIEKILVAGVDDMLDML